MVNKVVSTDISGVVTRIDSVATRAKVSGDLGPLIMDYSKIRKLNIKKLQDAVNYLESRFSNNCCQANCCQTCQMCQSQCSASCQICQAQCNCNCNCDCNDGCD